MRLRPRRSRKAAPCHLRLRTPAEGGSSFVEGFSTGGVVDVTAKRAAERLRLHEEFVTVEVDTGSRALEAAKNEYFDAILLDVGLPDMDGCLARLEISASIEAVDTVRMGNASSWRRPNRGRAEVVA